MHLANKFVINQRTECLFYYQIDLKGTTEILSVGYADLSDTIGEILLIFTHT